MSNFEEHSEYLGSRGGGLMNPQRLIWSDYSGGWLMVRGPGGFTEFACPKQKAESIAIVLQIPLEMKDA